MQVRVYTNQVQKCSTVCDDKYSILILKETWDKTITCEILTYFLVDQVTSDVVLGLWSQSQTWFRFLQSDFVHLIKNGPQLWTPVSTKFSAYLPYWPRFWPNISHIQSWPRHHQDKHSKWISKKIGIKFWPLL